MTRLTSDVTNIQNTVSTGMRPFCRGPVMLVAATAVAFSINRELAVVFLVALPLLACLLFLITMKVRPLYGTMQGAIDNVNRIIQENLTAVRVVKAYVRGDYEKAKFEEGNEKLKEQVTAGLLSGGIEYACHAVCYVRNHPFHPLVRRGADQHRRNGSGGTDRIF